MPDERLHDRLLRAAARPSTINATARVLHEAADALARAEADLETMRAVFEFVPYQGRTAVLCLHCHGRGDVPGRNHDDPRWLPCPTCKGDGLGDKARAALAAGASTEQPR